MDIFSRFNRKSIQDRQVDTLLGLAQGITADGRVDQSEAEALMTWLRQNSGTDNPLILNLLDKVSAMLEDDLLDDEESAELLDLLRKLTGEPSAVDEIAKATALPLDDPFPELVFSGRQFLFTGTFAFGTRKDCHSAVEALGGINAKGVTKSVNYVVLGTYVTDSWAHERYGRKIEKAMEYRASGVPLAIVSEQFWVDSAGL